MDEEFKHRQDASKGARAGALLNNELLTEAYDKIEADLIAAWIASNPRDTDGRERCFHAIHANRKHKAYLVSVVNDGKVAAAELKQLADNAERKKRFGLI